uniref:Dual OB-containing domain-containing protein n=1 Tax=Candidatus Kentrum sp. DK TaxID=2126562 RepID=A0A450SKN0_9GAMM|nr:MAG: hypothetical protein BECKDK2373C_GA0170839_10422 [Candidatus Kentron sp. DK]
MKKTIVVFANSVKHKSHCVAGKDIKTGKWIRPVADANGQELDEKQCRCINPYGEYMIKPLQKVEIKLVEHAPLPNQPENYIVGPTPWVVTSPPLSETSSVLVPGKNRRRGATIPSAQRYEQVSMKAGHPGLLWDENNESPTQIRRPAYVPYDRFCTHLGATFSYPAYRPIRL